MAKDYSEEQGFFVMLLAKNPVVDNMGLCSYAYDDAKKLNMRDLLDKKLYSYIKYSIQKFEGETPDAELVNRVFLELLITARVNYGRRFSSAKSAGIGKKELLKEVIEVCDSEIWN